MENESVKLEVACGSGAYHLQALLLRCEVPFINSADHLQVLLLRLAKLQDACHDDSNAFVFQTRPVTLNSCSLEPNAAISAVKSSRKAFIHLNIRLACFKVAICFQKNI
jgi:hypothetical protein